MDQPQRLFHLFLPFQTNITIFTANKCEKCPSSIWCQDSNSRPLEHESPPITTRPGLCFIQLNGKYAVSLPTYLPTYLPTWREVFYSTKTFINCGELGRFVGSEMLKKLKKRKQSCLKNK